jgi:hypothetical protein
MANSENVNSSEMLDSQQESQEQLANQKFDEIFNKIYGNKPSNAMSENGLAIQKDGDIK